jgi:hypothetical protein
MLSPAISSVPDSLAVLRFIVLGAALAAAIYHSIKNPPSLHDSRLLIVTLGFGAVLAVHSLTISVFPSLSLLKTLIWLSAICALILAFSSMKPEERLKAFQLTRWFLVIIVVISLPLIPLSSGYLRNGRGFQGILNHPQVFGQVAAILLVWEFTNLLTKSKFSIFGLGLLTVAITGTLLSQARSGGFAAVLAIATALFVMFGLNLRKHRPANDRVLPRILLLLVFILPPSAIFSSEIYEIASRFVSKYGGSYDSIFDLYSETRGSLIEPMVENVSKDPWYGLGFGVGSRPYNQTILYDPFFKLPVYAPTEKGLLFLMVLEEIGVVGALFFWLWFTFFFLRAINGDLLNISLFFCVFYLNFAEASLMSPGGIGLLTESIFILSCWNANSLPKYSITRNRAEYIPVSYKV